MDTHTIIWFFLHTPTCEMQSSENLIFITNFLSVVNEMRLAFGGIRFMHWHQVSYNLNDSWIFIYMFWSLDNFFLYFEWRLLKCAKTIHSKTAILTFSVYWPTFQSKEFAEQKFQNNASILRVISINFFLSSLSLFLVHFLAYWKFENWHAVILQQRNNKRIISVK